MKRIIKFLLYAIGIILLSRAWYIYWVKTNEKAAMLYAIPGAVMLITAIIWEVYVYFSISKQIERQNRKAALITAKLATPKMPRQRITDMNWYNYIGEVWDLFVSKLKYEKFNLKFANIIAVAIAIAIYIIGSIWNFSYYREISVTIGIGGIMLLSLGFYIKKAIKEHREKRSQMQPTQKPEKKKLAQVWVNDFLIILVSIPVSVLVGLGSKEKTVATFVVLSCFILIPLNHIYFIWKKIRDEKKQVRLQNNTQQNQNKGFKEWRESFFKRVFVKGLKTLAIAIYFFIAACISFIIGLLDESTISTILSFVGFIILYYPLYLWLSKIIGEGANKSTELFTAVGENEVKFVVNQSNQVLGILTPGDYITDENGELVKGENLMPTFFGGLPFVGIPVINRIFTYHFEWTKLEYYTAENVQKYRLIPRSETVHGLRIVQQQYIEINSLETDGNEKLTLGFLITYKIIYPAKVLFKNDSPGKWLVRSTAEIETMCGYHVANKSFNEIKAEDRSKHAVGSLSYKLIHEVSGHIENIDGLDYSKTLVQTVGVAIIDADLVKFESEEVAEIKEAQQLKLKATYEADAEHEIQRKQDIIQDRTNKRLMETSIAESTADKNRAKGKGAYYEAIKKAGGEQMYVAEKLSGKDSKIITLGGNTSTIMNVDKIIEDAKEDDKKKKS